MNTLKVLPVLWSLAAWMALAPSPARAVTDVWNGNGTDWNTVSDWNSAIPTSASSDTAVFNGTGNANLGVLLSSAGSVKNITFTTGAGAYTIGGAGTLTLASAGTISTDNFVTAAETLNTTLALSAGYTFSSNSATAADTLNIGGGISLGAAGTASLTLTGSNTGTNTVSGAITNGSGTLGLIKGGTGTWVLGGNNTYTGVTSLLGGTVVLDYTTNTGSKLGTGSALTMGGVNLQLNGGSAAQAVLSTNFNGGGQAAISRTTGSETLSLGAIATDFKIGTGTATTVNFQSGVATTTSLTTNTNNTGSNNILGSTAFATVGSQGAADWAATDASGNIVAYSTVNTYHTLGTGNDNVSTLSQFLVTDSVATTQANVNTLKIVTTGTTGNQTLTLGNNLTLGTNGGILDSALSSGLYTITGSTLTLGSSGTTIQQYGNGTLEIDSQVIGTGIYLQKGGSGTLVLTGNNVWRSALTINQGTVSAGSDANLGGQIGSVNVLSATSGGTTVTVDAVPWNLIVGSTLLGRSVTGISGTTITLSTGGANATITGSTPEVYTDEGSIVLDGGTLEATGTYSLSETTAGTTVSRAISVGADGGTIQVDGTNVLTAPGAIANQSTSAPGGLTKTGTGTLVLTGVNTYTGPTLVSAGTLAINNTSGSGLTGTAVTVASGAFLQGTGTLSTTTTTVIASGGTLIAGGGAVGTALTINGVLTLASGSTLQFTLGSGNTHSTLALSLAVAGNSFASGLQIDFANIQAGTYAGLITGLSADPTTEGSWVLAADDAGYSAVFTFSGGNINAVVTALAVPEPGESALLAGGLALLAAVGVARRRTAVDSEAGAA